MRETVDTTVIQPDWLYRSRLGGVFLRLIVRPFVSKIAGWFLDRRISKPLIKRFIKKHRIEMGDYLPAEYQSFNDFFTRRIRPELRPFDPSPEALCAPCDGAVTVYPVTREGKFTVKGFEYTAATLLKNEALAERYFGGLCVVIRLTVNDYHRYMFPDGGTRGEHAFIKGKLHTVRPYALERRRVFSENCREYTVLHTENFGDVTQVEVGAMFVGRIVNEEKESFSRGEEKGRFEFGGSTVILLLPANAAALDEEFFENTAQGKETKVRCGERIGRALPNIL